MMNCGSLVKSALVAIILVVASGHPDEKLASCCTKVNKLEITEPILGYLVQQRKPPCVQAVIFQTETGLYCSQLNAPWVLRKIRELRRAKAQTTASPMVSSSSASLLSIITSTASPPSSSTLLPSSSSSSSLSTSSSSISSTLLPSSFSSSSLSTSSSSISSTLLPSSSSSAPSLSSTLLPSSSTPSFSSASTTPADETFSGSDEE
ncbi:putative protein TPRXL isoform X2 [Kryptolebias marmoratus]|uniref:Cell wall integrity and stress response component 4-like n=1 Tax=Kryptolebias marmoratus TaxID=37003 RepID=A0A3Q3BIB9_KRYMA|nr:putative protein TPRXL isoform X2 [Kryptolebias marmoratus]